MSDMDLKYDPEQVFEVEPYEKTIISYRRIENE
jgi:hypothetical protein